MRRSATEKRFFCRSSLREGSSISTTFAGLLTCSGIQSETIGSVGDHMNWRTPSTLTDERFSCLSLISFMEELSYTKMQSSPRRAKSESSADHLKAGQSISPSGLAP